MDSVSDSASSVLATQDQRGPQPEFFLIGEIAEKVGFEPKTIRFYEKAGLLNPERHGRLRVFARSHIERLMLIKQLRQFEMPIAVIRTYLHQQEQDQPGLPGSRRTRDMLVAQLAELQRRREQTEIVIAQLLQMLHPKA